MVNAPLKTALDALHGQLELRVDFPPEVLAEAQAWLASPGVQDPALVDRTAWPFVTVDAATSKDLDQALYVERTSTGFLVAYAIADAAFYVRPGSALFAEAMKRGASYYFPQGSVPMLPRALSEGLISLNPNEDRRALLFLHELGADGSIQKTRLERARVRSRAKLSFREVQALVDTPQQSPLRGADFQPSLVALRDVGRARMGLAERRGLVRYRREEVEVSVDGEGLAFTVMEAVRDEVELWNEQLSLLCNAEGGRLLRESGNAAIQPIYRVQPGPDQARLDALARLTERLCAVLQLPHSPWRWDAQATPLAEYLRQLPAGPLGSTEDRLARALTRQAVMVNLRSEYSTEPGPHTGVGAEPYARFSAPMREMVGVFLHKEAVELLTGEHPGVEADEALRAQVVQVANRSRGTQRRAQDLTNALVMERLFGAEAAKPPAERRTFGGTVMGLVPGKVHVRLDAPPLDVKLYFFDLAKHLGGAWLEVAEEGVVLRAKGSTQPLFTLGQAVALQVDGRDVPSGRWRFKPVR